VGLQPTKPPKIVFFGIHFSVIFTKFGLGKRVPSPHPHAKFHRCAFKNVGLQPPKSRKMVIFGINFLLMENSGGPQKKLSIDAQLQTFLYAITS